MEAGRMNAFSSENWVITADESHEDDEGTSDCCLSNLIGDDEGTLHRRLSNPMWMFLEAQNLLCEGNSNFYAIISDDRTNKLYKLFHHTVQLFNTQHSDSLIQSPLVHPTTGEIIPGMQIKFLKS